MDYLLTLNDYFISIMIIIFFAILAVLIFVVALFVDNREKKYIEIQIYELLYEIRKELKK